MAYTKIRDYHDGTFGLLVFDSSKEKYTQIARGKKGIINLKRSEVRAESIDLKAELHKKTFIEVYEEFVKSKLDEAAHAHAGVKYESVKPYEIYFRKYIKPYFSQRILIKEMTPQIHVVPFFLKLREVGLKWVTANNVVKTFKTCMKFAVLHQYTKSIGAFAEWSARKDTATRSRNPSEMKYKKTKMISLQEAKKVFFHLLPAKENKDIRAWQKFALVSTFMFSGMRMSEVRGLRWEAINFKVGKMLVDHSVTGYGGSLVKEVKAKGSDRIILLHPHLRKILLAYKGLLTYHFTGRKMPLVFPSLRNTGGIVPLADRTITNWLKLTYAELGYAKVSIRKKATNDSDGYVQLLECRFGHAVTRTFRHLFCTALYDAQKKYPVLDNNFTKGQSGHEQYETFAELYGDHKNFDTSTEHEEEQRLAIEKALPIGLENNQI